ncbi:MAG: hypothetical protein WBW73_07375 [Rhodoplanes sp.]
MTTGESQGVGMVIDRVGQSIARAPAFRQKMVAQDRGEPGHHVGSRFEQRDILAAAGNRLLHEIFCLISIAAQFHRKGTQLWKDPQHRIVQ